MQDEWVPNLHYHLIGEAVPGELLFREDVDYRRFLRKSLRDGLKHVSEFHVYCPTQQRGPSPIASLPLAQRGADADARGNRRAPRRVEAEAAPRGR